MAYQRVESALPYQYKEKERRDERMRNLLNMFMMTKQVGEERGEREWEREVEKEERERKFERWGVQEELWGAQTERALRPQVPREPSIPAEIQAAQIVAEQTGRTVGEILNAWKSRKPVKPEEPGIKKSRQKWIEGLDRDVAGRIKNLMSMKEFGLMEDPTRQVENLQSIKTKIRAALAIGADQPLPSSLWKELGRISERLEKIGEEGLYPPEKKPSVKAKLPKIKKAKLPPGTEIKWNLKDGIRMAKIDGVWHWVIE